MLVLPREFTTFVPTIIVFLRAGRFNLYRSYLALALICFKIFPKTASALLFLMTV
jgi:hypothetical protein